MGIEDRLEGSGFSRGRRNFIFWQLPLFYTLMCSIACGKSEPTSKKTRNGPEETFKAPISTQQQLDRYFLGLNVEELRKYDEYFRVPDKQKIYEICGKVGIDPLLVFAIMKQESDFDPNALSNMQAYGYMQVTKIAHEEIYRLIFDQDPHYQSKRERMERRDRRRLEAIKDITNGLFDDQEILSLFERKGSKRNKKLNKEIKNKINRIFGSYSTRGDVDNDSLIPIGVSYLALAETELSGDIDLVISSYNQGIERTQRNQKPMSRETRNYLRHINENHPTFTDIHKKLLALGRRFNLDLDELEEMYYNFKSRLLDEKSLNSDLFVYHRGDKSLPGIIYQIENGETIDSVSKTEKFRRYAVTENFERYNPGVDPKNLKQRDFVVIPLILIEATQIASKPIEATPVKKKSREKRFYEIAEGHGFIYRGRNSEGKAVYRHKVKPGETLQSIAIAFNHLDDANSNLYASASSQNIRTKRNFQLDRVQPKHEVYVVISKK